MRRTGSSFGWRRGRRLVTGTTMYTKSTGGTCHSTTTPTGQLWHASDMVKADPSTFVAETLSPETR